VSGYFTELIEIRGNGEGDKIYVILFQLNIFIQDINRLQQCSTSEWSSLNSSQFGRRKENVQIVAARSSALFSPWPCSSQPAAYGTRVIHKLTSDRFDTNFRVNSSTDGTVCTEDQVVYAADYNDYSVHNPIIIFIAKGMPKLMSSW